MFRLIVKKFFTFLNAILFRVEFINPEKLPLEGPAILVANHQNIFDISFIHCKTKPWVYWVGKRELVDIPIFGRLVLMMGVMPVDRKKSDLSVAKSLFANLKAGRVIGIFPQGTRVRGYENLDRVIPKTGAVHFSLKTKTPVIPIGVYGSFKLFSKMKVVVGDPIDFSKVEGDFHGNELLMKQTIFMMKKIYSLIDVEYNIDESLLHVEKNL
jgi:1-acyl-sn-glycerol-3-phosphate acyltransferase